MLLQRSPDPVLAEARATTRRVARTFAVSCRLLPREVRDDVHRLYLVFRTLDDLVDHGHPEAQARVEAVEAWCADGTADSREAALLADLAARHPLPRDAVRDFCAGMREDLAGARLSTEADLDRYCYRVAGTVGVVMAELLGVGDREAALRAAAALGMAMQRTNILRDIDEDLAKGRVYLPREAIDRCGCTLDPGCREALVRDQIARADALYDRGVEGVDLLLRGRRAVGAAAAMYREILRQIEREGYGAQPGRAVVPRRRKLLVAARARP
ncbi:MAG TPA: squalene/phytoene synthase family protein [Solirubrobacteraceae bacterium]|nr:squalene/phytoene synthase family protein [Solirubrobacteraceae bacterium]